MVMTLVGLPTATFAQRHRATADFARYDTSLRAVLPDADTFRFVDTGTSHYRGYRTDATGNETLVGFGFFTVDFAPKVRGYKGEIWILIGMDPGGTLTNISIVYHNEPFGYFSIDLPTFVEQFPWEERPRPADGRRRHRCGLARHDHKQLPRARYPEQRAPHGP